MGQAVVRRDDSINWCDSGSIDKSGCDRGLIDARSVSGG